MKRTIAITLFAVAVVVGFAVAIIPIGTQSEILNALTFGLFFK